MNYLSTDQLRILKLCREPVQFQELTDDEKSICRFLSSQGYVKFSIHNKYDDYSDRLRSITDTATITEAGLSYLATYETKEIRYFKEYRLDIIAIIIAAAALIISIIALFK